MRHYLCTGITFINESDKELQLTFFFDLVFSLILGKPHFIAWHVTLCWETDAQIDHNCDCVGTDSYLGNYSVFQKKQKQKKTETRKNKNTTTPFTGVEVSYSGLASFSSNFH
jgi:hypothetical protein